ncbi:NAD(P)-binding protein [Trematosphaeria pertusa]|uniref:NAD(P)-binding protein n=1 Tax=Trematosphaeria pertusa TaxID=390896 RepID=A0A6A6I7G9_9PLEO|nr:NAD(P)-binding protein [Trematosphaeria pertusa]KAF2245902.1 NAD(P)-binding protein [Trematosphaeria pertusa]
MPFDFTGKIIAVSGAASGIGFATAQYLYSAGASLSLTDVREDALKAATERLVTAPSPTTDKQLQAKSADRSTLPGAVNAKPDSSTIVHDAPRLLAMTANVANSAHVDAWIARTVEKFAKLDGAANMAGVSSRAAGVHPITEVSDEDWAFNIDINLTGTFYCMRAQLRAVQTSSAGSGNGKTNASIVNASSIYGIQGKACSADYSAAKHGVVGLTRSVAKEFGGKGIRVNCVAPGIIDTPMVQNLSPEFLEGHNRTLQFEQSLHRMADAEEIARVNAFLLSGESSFVTGAVYVADGGQVC